MSPMTWALASGCCISICRLITYFGGRAGCPLDIALFPAEFLPMIGAAAFGIGTFATVAEATWQGRFAIAFRSTGVLLILWILPPLLLPAHLYLLGFKHRVACQITSDQLRLARAKAAALLPTETAYLSGTGKSLWDPDKHSAMWAEMNSIPGIASLDARVVITSHDGVVSMTWGGTLIGHWGLRIYPTVATRGPHDVEYWAPERDIAFFMESD